MLSRTRSVATALALVAATATSALGQSHFTFVNGGTVTGFGYYVGTYNGVMAPSTPVGLNCVDFFHHIHNGQQWDAHLTSLAGASSLANTRLGLQSALSIYQQAAWLVTQYSANPSSIPDIQATIWNLVSGGGPTPSSSSWLTAAQTNYASINYNEFFVVTDVNKSDPASAQEFIVWDKGGDITTNTTPEPGTVILLATGLLGLAPAARRRFRKDA